MSTFDSAFLCRLLSASAAAYGIQTDGSLDKKQPYYDNVGYTEDPTPIAGGVENIDAALVGINGDGIIVAFRGTLPPIPPITAPIILDWLQDFVAEPKAFVDFPGEVHSGFFSSIMSIWADVLHAVQSLLDKNPGANIYVTGHSKGGSLASLGAWLLNSNKLTPAGVVTFAAAHAGNSEFASVYNKVFGQQIRYENYLDIVPFVPPESEFFSLLEKIPYIGKLFAGAENWDYMPVGNLQYIEENGTVAGDSFGLSTIRIAEITEKIVTGDFSDVANAHSLVGYSLGYCRSVCPDNLCNGGSTS